MATIQIIRHLPLRLSARRLFHSSPSWREQKFNASMADFDRIVSNGPDDRVVLVDFYADWCGPCHALSPILKDATNPDEEKGRTAGSGRKLDLLTIDVENESGGNLSQEFQVRALPTVVAFRGGKQVDKFVGALNKQGVHQFLDKL
ncbi:thioredoxin-like protein [Mycena galopus ATCC 62051]|nr:thioredoxin-like protein [Mycena galopus ATCC 62051]